ncbi:GTPase [Holophaga foetida]|uniref:GTPase n=1 Tax=Holophaga foetida TaxID=35839 RepID=UPI0002471C44|nr:GTPase [Holophaga foetida]
MIKQRKMGEPRPLVEAISQAIEDGKGAIKSLELKFNSVQMELRKASELVEPWQTAGASSAADAFCRMLGEREAEIQRLFERQRACLTTLNLAFFGRTGAGKSSLIEALTHGTGETVSKGESDWTVEVRPVAWSGCRLLDTPGINGWGRTEKRTSLEAQARLAVETADLVFLCFDSQSQQEGEFAKVAEWIHAYGKPSIAVLNCRNQHWRFPPRVEFATQRRNLSQAVQQHEGNIRDGLTSLGLGSIPVVALSAKRALMARAREPFLGPDATTFARHRAEHGQARLLAWSNLPVLEALVVEALERDAAGIRLGMLVAQVRGAVDRLEAELAQTENEAEQLSKVMEAAANSLLKTLGYPPEGKARAGLSDVRIKDDLLSELERLRRAPFTVPEEGEFQIHCRQMFEASFGKLRSSALARADRAVLDSFDRREELSSEAFATEVFDESATQKAADEVLAKAGKFLERKVNLTLKDTGIDLACLIQAQPDPVKGNAGKAWAWAGNISRVAGLLVGAGGAGATWIAGGLAVAAANAWNPFGWTAGAYVVAAGVLAGMSTLLNWFGGKAARKAEESRARARREALHSAKRSVDNAFGNYFERLTQVAAEKGIEALGQTLSHPLREAIAARLVLQATKKARAQFHNLRKALPERDPQTVINEAALAVENHSHPGRTDSGGLVWRGEDWIMDPEGLVAQQAPEQPVRALSRRTTLEGILDSLRDFFTLDHPKAGAGKAWLTSARKTLLECPGGSESVADLDLILQTGRPRLHLLGDYNTGKTSFLKRLLIDAGEPVPPDATVRANPTTSQVTEHAWEGFTLVDTPGFQSLRAEDTQTAADPIPDATHLVCLFQPNLLGSTLDLLCPVLEGNLGKGLAPKLERALFVINRADELGPDPEYAPEEFDRACERKQKELMEALRRRGIEVDPARVVCMAADPFGRVGNRQDVNATEFDPFRDWDGITLFIKAVRSAGKRAKRLGLDISLLEGGLARAGRFRCEANEARQVAHQTDQALCSLASALESATSESERLERNLTARLDRLLDEHIGGMIAEAMGAANDKELAASAKVLASWWTTPEFREDFTRWEETTRAEVDRWVRRTMEELGRRLGSVEFKQAFPGLKAAFDASGLDPQAKGHPWWKSLETVAKIGGSRDVIYKVGKFLGVKFKPWGAVKLASKVSKFSVVLSGIGVALDAADWVASHKQAGKREKARKDAWEFLRRSRDELRATILSSGDASGVQAYLTLNQEEMQTLATQLRIEAAEARQSACRFDARIKRLGTIMIDARDRLGLEKEEETSHVDA